jgi:hypothetical protein
MVNPLTHRNERYLTQPYAPIWYSRARGNTMHPQRFIAVISRTHVLWCLSAELRRATVFAENVIDLRSAVPSAQERDRTREVAGSSPASSSLRTEPRSGFASAEGWLSTKQYAVADVCSNPAPATAKASETAPLA